MSKMKELQHDIAEHGEFAQIYFYPTKGRWDIRLPKFEETDSLMMGQGKDLEEALEDLNDKIDDALGVVEEEPEEEVTETTDPTEAAPDDQNEGDSPTKLKVGLTPGGKDHLFEADEEKSLCAQVDREGRDFITTTSAEQGDFVIDLCGSCLNATDQVEEGDFDNE